MEYVLALATDEHFSFTVGSIYKNQIGILVYQNTLHIPEPVRCIFSMTNVHAVQHIVQYGTIMFRWELVDKAKKSDLLSPWPGPNSPGSMCICTKRLPCSAQPSLSGASLRRVPRRGRGVRRRGRSTRKRSRRRRLRSLFRDQEERC
jgi:hypothetical protein